ncbi:GYDIA family GHMP kinase [Gilvibacter sediminis]|uniref:GYDIA family GHMP kinase n=1 Tax=Gilvibacter sediminis TaxID=379071 RepID=UPI0023509760|nr:GYDIA family GHMP kinase [Gilvibacter sediminis]MDC7997389.1 GYDIA family GHMP kinase [Gilvibacter sediminis]
MQSSFHSNGKLLLTGEYMVLDGALALAVPSAYGQRLQIKDNSNKQLHWKSFNKDGNLWFTADIDVDRLDQTATDPVEEKLRKLLLSCVRLNPDFKEQLAGKEVQTHLEFPRDWGLGSSSTLINNLAQWAAVNPFELLDLGFGGSGYDIACAFSDGPISYRKNPDNSRTITPVAIDWPFADQLYFVHLNQKMDSKLGIQRYRSQNMPDPGVFSTLDHITEALIKTTTKNEFDRLLNEHESIIARVIDQLRIQTTLFPDYQDGVIKSLGAWGGDFVMVSGNEKSPDYFKSKGFNTVIPFWDMLIKKPRS